MSAILVAYATKNGSTRQVAEAVATAAREQGWTVDLRPAGEVRGSLARWDLVVVGAPIYSGRWHRAAHRFLRRHRRELARRSVAVFALGPRSGTEEAWQRSRRLVVTVANWIYVWGHWPLIIATLCWLAVRHPQSYRRTRDAMLLAGLAGLVVFALFPVNGEPLRPRRRGRAHAGPVQPRPAGPAVRAPRRGAKGPGRAAGRPRQVGQTGPAAPAPAWP